MALASHLDTLKSKHEALKVKIKDEERRPSADRLEIATLKRRKLHLKEEIERLASDTQ